MTPHRRPRTRLGFLLPSLGTGVIATLLSASPGASQPLTVVDVAAVRSPRQAVLAADGSRAAWILGDTLWSVRLQNGAPLDSPIPVSPSMSGVGSYLHPFIALSPDGRHLVHLVADPVAGGGTAERAVLTTFDDDAVRSRPLLPDSLSGMRLFAHFNAGPPAFDRSGRHLAFLGATGESSLQPWVLDVATGELTQWSDGEGMHYSVAFSPDGRWLATSGRREDGGFVELREVASGGEGSHTVVAGAEGYLHGLLWSPSGSTLLAQGSDNVAQAWTVGDDGSASHRPVDLPRGQWQGWLDDDHLVTRRMAGMTPRLVVVPVDGGAVTPVATPPGSTSFAGLARSGTRTHLLWLSESGDTPPDLWVAEVGAEGRIDDPVRLTDANPDFSAVQRFESRVVEWTAAEGGARLHAQLLLPRDRQGPVPLVVLPYGSYTDAFPRSEYFLDLGVLPLLSRGWGVVRPNTRDHRTHPETAGQYGEVQLADTRTLIEDLATRGIIDPQRVATIGHSHGGSLVWYFATHGTDFCAAVAANGRTDWRAQVEHGDGYLVAALGGTPEEVPARYAAGSPIENVESLSTPTLAIVGGQDTQILPGRTLEMVDRLRALDRPVELLHYPEEGHLFPGSAERREIWDAVFGLLEGGC